MLKEDADQSYMSIGAEIENIHSGGFRKLEFWILVSIYQGPVEEGKKKTQQKLLRANREPPGQINNFRVKY